MMFKKKLQEILKNERISLIIFSSILIILMPFILWFVFEEYNPSKLPNLLCIFTVYFLLVTIVVKKVKIIKEIRWSLIHFVDEPLKVQDILKVRKASLISYHGEISLYSLYDEALKLFPKEQMKKCG